MTGSVLSGIPARVAGWSVTAISAGLWLSADRADPPARAQAFRTDGRPSLVVDAECPDKRTDELIAGLFPLLSARPVRLVLSAAGSRYAVAAAASGLDLIAAEGTVVITPDGYAVVRPGPDDSGTSLPQWRRFLPSGATEAAGVLAPSPAWERGLAAAMAAAAGQGLAVRRVPAGLALHLAEPDADDVPQAAVAWPDPERITIIMDGAGLRSGSRDGPLAQSLQELLPLLPLSGSDGVRLYSPRAGTGAGANELARLASSVHVDLIAPAGDVSVTGHSALCHGPVGAAPWLRFSSSGEVEVLGSLLPAPAWDRALSGADLKAPLEAGQVEHIAAGLYLPPRPGFPSRGLTATARSIIPDPGALTLVVGGDATDRLARQDLEIVLRLLPAAARARLRLVMARAGAGGPASFAQLLASAFGCRIAAPVGRWTATPDGRVAELRGAGSGSWVPEVNWAQFRPLTGRGRIAARRRRPSGDPSPRVQQEDALPSSAEWRADAGALAAAAPEAAGEPLAQAAPAAPSGATGASAAVGQVISLPHDHQSSAAERQRYRKNATGYRSLLGAARRMLTQRPGLRSAAAGNAGDAVVTDFAAVLDLVGDDHSRVTAALREGAAASDPRIACAMSGLRRLPSFTGVVYTSAHSDGVPLSVYAPGTMVTEPSFVFATSSSRVALDGDVEYVIWSEAGRRLAALVADARRDEIVFAAGTRFRILACQRSGDRTSVLLREQRPVQTLGSVDDMDRRVLDRLAAAAALRLDAPKKDQHLSAFSVTSLLIGVDGRGTRFTCKPTG